ncbi:M23 family metallopeptidase [Nocardia sp. IFM 10818]
MTSRRVLAALLALGAAMAAFLLLIPVLVVVSVTGSAFDTAGCGGTALPAGAAAAPTDPAVLAEAQLRNVRTIIAVGEQLGLPEQAIVVALAVAGQESGFRMLANDGSDPRLRDDQRDVDRSLQFPHDGVGSDHGSVNFMQQQYPWWGSLEELMDPQVAALKFYQALEKVEGWQAMAVTVAAQTVQGSAYPDAYADDEPLARALFAANQGAAAGAPPLPGSATAAPAGAVDPAATIVCGTGAAMTCPATGEAAEQGLTPDALRVLRCLGQQFGAHRWVTVGERPAGTDRDHQEGRAVDAMTRDRADGDAIAAWVTAHADDLGVKYVIWWGRIWQRPGMGQPGQWSDYVHPNGEDSDTAAHRDHVHVSVYGDAAGTTVSTAGDGTARLPLDPGRYVISSEYGPRDGTFHAGTDFAADPGTPIYAVTGGTVTVASDLGDGYGECVRIVSDDHTVETLYAHQNVGAITVRVGDHVTAGDMIGAVGSTGHSTGPHLHYEVRVNGHSVDPRPYLTAKGLRP